MRARFRLVLLTASLAASACSDPTDPCDLPDACEITGVDLAIIDARLVAGTQSGTDSETDLPVYAAGPVAVEFTIANRGDATSARQPLSNSDTVPPLEPGELYHTRVTTDYTGQYLTISSLQQDVDLRRADLAEIQLTMPQGGSAAEPVDAEPANNEMTHEFHVAIPLFAGTVADIGEVRQNEPVTVPAVLENVSLHQADSPAVDVVLCMWMVHFGCREGQWEYMSRTPAPALPAGATLDLDLPATLRMESMPYPETAYLANLLLCIVPTGHTGPFLPDGAVCVDQSEDLTYRPDYESCNPPVAQIGQILTLDEKNCGEPVGDSRHFYLFAFDAAEGVPYTIEPALTMHDADGNVVTAENPVTLPAGRYYFVAFREQFAWLEVSLAGTGARLLRRPLP